MVVEILGIRPVLGGRGPYLVGIHWLRLVIDLPQGGVGCVDRQGEFFLAYVLILNPFAI